MNGSAVRRRSVLKRTLALVAVVGLLWSGWASWNARRDRMALRAVHQQIEAGRYEIARRALRDLIDHRPDWGEAAFLLGVCEHTRGNWDAAAAAWARVQPASQWSTPATLKRAELLAQRGRQADAEQLVEQALADPRIAGSSLRWFLVPFYWQEGRVDEAERLLEADWNHLNRAADSFVDQSMKLVEAHMRLARGKGPEPGFRRTILRQAQQAAPGDDRLWLAKANLALSEGSLDEAARLLELCLRRRPDDVPVWKARLRWAMATKRIAEVQLALGRVPADATTRAEVDRLAAWLAAQKGDAQAERRALERLLADAPADIAAWDRLGELAGQSGQSAYIAELRRRKSELDAAQARYEATYRRNQPLRDAEELARLAAELGRWFEARVFLTIAAMVHPARGDPRAELTRLEHRQKLDTPQGLSLADVLATD
jgi:tetratricopeptide (TPR) repeat protein